MCIIAIQSYEKDFIIPNHQQDFAVFFENYACLFLFLKDILRF